MSFTITELRYETITIDYDIIFPLKATESEGKPCSAK